MTLDSLAKGKSATITAINAKKELKHRLNSLGLAKGVIVKAEQHSLAKQTMEIRIDNTRLILRHSEAKQMEVSE